MIKKKCKILISIFASLLSPYKLRGTHAAFQAIKPYFSLLIKPRKHVSFMKNNGGFL